MISRDMLMDELLKTVEECDTAAFAELMVPLCPYYGDVWEEYISFFSTFFEEAHRRHDHNTVSKYYQTNVHLSEYETAGVCLALMFGYMRQDPYAGDTHKSYEENVFLIFRNCARMVLPITLIQMADIDHIHFLRIGNYVIEYLSHAKNATREKEELLTEFYRYHITAYRKLFPLIQNILGRPVLFVKNVALPGYDTIKAYDLKTSDLGEILSRATYIVDWLARREESLDARRALLNEGDSYRSMLIDF